MRGARGRGLLAVGVALTLATPAWGSSASADEVTAKDTWHVAATLGLGADDTAVACRTVASCWALEAGQLVSSVDAGGGWTEETSLVPAGIAALVDLDCPAVSTCYLTAVQETGESVILVLDTGAKQISLGPVLGTEPLVISCAGAQHCMASNGKRVYSSHDPAGMWTTSSPAAIVYSNPALHCVRATSWCWLVGNNGEDPVVERTTNDGESWQVQSDNVPPPPQTDGIYDVACPSTSVCYLAGADMPDDAILLGTTDGGASWSLLDMPHQDYAVHSVACTSTTSCWASGLPPSGIPSMYATTDGRHWTAQTLPTASVLDSPEVACPAEGSCVAVAGGIAYDTADGGETWGSTELPAVTDEPRALTCATAKTCVGISNDALGRPVSLTSHDGGSTWARHVISAKESNAWDVDCPTVSACYAMTSGRPGRPGAVVTHAFTSTDGGEHWRVKRATKKGIVTTLSCPEANTCLAGGFDLHSAAMILVTTDGGATWRPVAAPPGAFYLGGVSCASVTACVVVTQGVSGPPVAWTTDDLGATYQQHEMPGDSDFYDVGCAGTTCVAVGSKGGDSALALSVDGGKTWKRQQLPAGVQILGRVSCGSAAACAATGFDYTEDGGPLIVGTRNAGASWHAFRVPARQQEPTDVACVGSRCIASDTSLAGNPLILAGPA